MKITKVFLWFLLLCLGIAGLAGCIGGQIEVMEEEEEIDPISLCQLAEWRSIFTDLPVVQLVDWSGDGSRIAFVGPGETSSYVIGNLMVSEGPDFESLITLAENVNGGVIWSPDDEEIAFTGLRKNDQLYTISVASSDGGGEIDLFPGVEARTDELASFKIPVDWLSTEFMLVLSECGLRCQQLFLVDTLRAQQLPLAAPEEIGAYTGAGFEKADMVTSGGYFPAVGVLDPENLKIEWVYRDLENDTVWPDYTAVFVGWGIDPARMYYLKQPYNFSIPPELWVWDNESQTDSYLLNGVVSGDISPDASKFAFLALGSSTYNASGDWLGILTDSNKENPLIFGILDLSTGEPQVLQELGAVYSSYNPFAGIPGIFSPVWSGDGKIVAYADQFGNVRLYLIDEEREVIFARQFQTALEADWSPDGEMLAVRTETHVVVYDTACLLEQ